MIGDAVDLDINKVVDVNLVSVEEHENFLDVLRELVFEDGSTVPGKHRLPKDTLEWRAAEYGLDPADLDTLLDIVLWEPFLPEPDQPELTLYEADSVESARDYHLARIKARQPKGKPPGTPGPPDAVRERIKGLAVINPQALGLKRALVAQTREKVKRGKEERAKGRLRALFVPGAQEEMPNAEEERLARLRAHLDADTPRTNKEQR